uniref:Cytochrome P450 n=1 Tax=Arion vulgaris TaxID=1028688 RepID=A0A0B7B0P9_9EUPU
MQIPFLSDLQCQLTFAHVLLLVLLLLTLVYYLYATSYHGVWEKYNVPGPRPWPILDHTIELRAGVNAAFKKWFNVYGNTFGAYGLLPHRATLVTKDLSLVKQILVKDFDNYSYRIRSQESQSSIRNGLSSAGGDRWRRHRQVASPMFTGSKMKMIINHVCASAETLTEFVKQSLINEKLVPIKFISSKFSAEVIARIGFGISSQQAAKEETEFAKFATNFAKLTDFKYFVNSARYYFPPIDKILRLLNIDVDFVDKSADTYFVSILKSTIEERQKEAPRTNGRKARDMLDLFTDAAVENGDPRLQDVNSKTLSLDEIIGNATALIIAGVETVSSSLQSILYCLVFYPDIQENVVKEINRVIPPGQALEYEHLQELKYTEQVISECLRLFPLITSVFRLAKETRKYNDITIPAGCSIQIPIGLIMKDPEHWPEPEKFDPGRFSPTNKSGRDPLAFMPFGYGPRLCLGMRLALLELKVILVYLLKEVQFTLSDRTQPKKGEIIKMETMGMAFLRPVKPVALEVNPRK